MCQVVKKIILKCWKSHEVRVQSAGRIPPSTEEIPALWRSSSFGSLSLMHETALLRDPSGSELQLQLQMFNSLSSTLVRKECFPQKQVLKFSQQQFDASQSSLQRLQDHNLQIRIKTCIIHFSKKNKQQLLYVPWTAFAAVTPPLIQHCLGLCSLLLSAAFRLLPELPAANLISSSALSSSRL